MILVRTSFYGRISSVVSNKRPAKVLGFFMPEGDRVPYKPKRPCSHPSCPRLTHSRFCEEHAKQHARLYERNQRNPNTHKRYGSKWRKIRKEYLEHHPFCQLCREAGRRTRANTVHHIKAVSEGGSSEWNNLMALCRSCHSALHAKQGDRWQ